MTTDRFLLSFELSKNGDEVDIHCDHNGLDKLILVLSQLKGQTQHEHLMTPSLGGAMSFPKISSQRIASY